MPVLNNDVLGQFKAVRQKRSVSFLYILIGSVIGILFSLALKTITVYFLWNLLLPNHGFLPIEIQTAYVLTAISSILVINYSKTISGLEMAIDMILKSAIIIAVAILFNYL